LLLQQLPSAQPSFEAAGAVASMQQPSMQHALSPQQLESQLPEAQSSGVQLHSIQQDLGAAVWVESVRL
jgi:hypothetical protein